jgi:hypothetical protein
MAELLTQLQDQLDSISRKFFEAVGVLQRDAPPVSTSGEALIAPPPVPGFDVQATVKRMTEELIAQVKETQELLQLLPDTNPAAATAVGSSSGMLLPVGGLAQDAAAAAFEADIQQLQAQHEAVSGQLAAAVEEVEGLVLQLQQLYAAQAQATLAAGPVQLPVKQQEQGEQGS